MLEARGGMGTNSLPCSTSHSTAPCPQLCEWDVAAAPFFHGHRVERCLLDLGMGSLALWLNQSCLHGRFFWLLLGDHPITYLLPIKSGWVAHGWKGFQGCRALQAFACHVGVKPWTLFSSSVTLIKSRQAGRIWLGMFL